MITRCIACRKDAITHDMVWVEPISGEDSTAMYLRGWICHDCEVVHWAWPFEDETAPSDVGGLGEPLELASLSLDRGK